MDLPDDLPLLGFDDASAFTAWLAEVHAEAAGVWLKIPKKGGRGKGPTYAEALDAALRFGWIDSQKRRLDDDHYLQRFTRRARRSPWSKVNRRKAEALIAAGQMAPAGLAEVEAAKDDGRWDRAYAGSATATVPPDLRAALDAVPAAAAFFEATTASNRFAILYRVQEAKRPQTRARRIAAFVEACARGEKVV